MKGWLDSFAGPVGLIIGIGKGIMRVFYNNPFTADNFIPADTVAKAIIVAGWKRGVMKYDKLHSFKYHFLL